MDAARLALEEKIAIYDAMYVVALARFKAGLATFDERLQGIIAKHAIPLYP